MAFLIRSLTAPPEAGSTPEENASNRLVRLVQKYFGKNSQSQACATPLHLRVPLSQSLSFLAVLVGAILIQSFLDPQESDTKLRKKWDKIQLQEYLGNVEAATPADLNLPIRTESQ
jgi:hypothetical protein